MIKFAVTLPEERWGAVNHGIGMLDWGSDPYLKNYGLKISSSPAEIKGRVLPTPDVQFL
jgi:eukaryotic translation initiation factor 2C